jgi:cyanate permease
LVACLTGLCLSVGVIAGSLPPFIPVLMGDLGLTPVTAGVALGAWQAATAIVSVPAGLLLDRIPVRAGIVAGAALSVLSCILRGLALDAPTLIVSVASAGVGWPLLLTGSAKVLGTFGGRLRQLAAGITLAAVSCGFAVSVAAGNPLATHIGGWRPALMVAGVPMVVATVVWLVFSGPLASERSLTSLAQVARDLRELLGNRAVLIALGATIGGLATGHALSNWLPTLLRADGFPGTVSDLSAAGFTAVGILGALALPMLARPANRRWWIVAVLFADAIAMALLATRLRAPIPFALVGAGAAVGALPPLVILALLDTEGVGARAGAVTGLYYSVTGIAGLLGPFLVGWLTGATGTFAAGLVTLAVIAGLAGLLATRHERSGARRRAIDTSLLTR